MGRILHRKLRRGSQNACGLLTSALLHVQVHVGSILLNLPSDMAFSPRWPTPLTKRHRHGGPSGPPHPLHSVGAPARLPKTRARAGGVATGLPNYNGSANRRLPSRVWRWVFDAVYQSHEPSWWRPSDASLGVPTAHGKSSIWKNGRRIERPDLEATQHFWSGKQHTSLQSQGC